MRAEETFDPPKNGGRVLLSNPGDCQQTTQKRTGVLWYWGVAREVELEIHF